MQPGGGREEAGTSSCQFPKKRQESVKARVRNEELQHEVSGREGKEGVRMLTSNQWHRLSVTLLTPSHRPSHNVAAVTSFGVLVRIHVLHRFKAL